jgi:hypothetical protein
MLKSRSKNQDQRTQVFLNWFLGFGSYLTLYGVSSGETASKNDHNKCNAQFAPLHAHSHKLLSRRRIRKMKA